MKSPYPRIDRLPQTPLTALRAPSHDGGEPSWLHGGSEPFVYPWRAGEVGLRFQSREKAVTRLERCLSTSGPFVGLGADHSS